MPFQGHRSVGWFQLIRCGFIPHPPKPVSEKLLAVGTESQKAWKTRRDGFLHVTLFSPYFVKRGHPRSSCPCTCTNRPKLFWPLPAASETSHCPKQLNSTIHASSRRRRLKPLKFLQFPVALYRVQHGFAIFVETSRLPRLLFHSLSDIHALPSRLHTRTHEVSAASRLAPTEKPPSPQELPSRSLSSVEASGKRPRTAMGGTMAAFPLLLRA